jgi:hypothetical protein
MDEGEKDNGEWSHVSFGAGEKDNGGGHTLLLERARKTTAGGRIRKRRKKHKLEVLHIGSIQFSEHLFGPSR